MAETTNPKIILEFDPATGVVAVLGPLDHPTMMLKMLASAVSQVAGLVQPIATDAAEKPEPSRIIRLDQIRRA